MIVPGDKFARPDVPARIPVTRSMEHTVLMAAHRIGEATPLQDGAIAEPISVGCCKDTTDSTDHNSYGGQSKRRRRLP
jgi:hypothetical protein